jgi:hypothetical protein
MLLLLRDENIQTLDNLTKQIKELPDYWFLVFGTMIVLPLIEYLVE